MSSSTKKSLNQQQKVESEVKSLKQEILEELSHLNVKNKESITLLRNISQLLQNNTALHAAVKQGNVNLVKNHLASDKKDLNSQNKKGDTALHIALENRKKQPDSQKHKDIENHLLKNGANKSIENNKGDTYLANLQNLGSSNKQFKEHSNNVLKQSNQDELRHSSGKNLDNSALRSFTNNDLEQYQKNIVPKIKGKGNGIDDTNSMGDSIAHLSSHDSRDNDWLKAHIDNDGTLLDKNDQGDLPLHIATRENNHDAVDTIIKGKKGDKQHKDDLKTMLNTKNQEGDTPFTLSLQKGKKNQGQVEKYLKLGADVNTKYDGNTPLGHAIKNKNDKLVNTLLSHKADVNIKDDSKNKCSPLVQAVKDNNLNLVEQLLKNGADVHLRCGPQNQDALDTALLQSNNYKNNQKGKYINQEIIIQLIGYLDNDKVNETDEHGKTKLHHLAEISNNKDADQSFNTGIMKHLIHDKKADLTLKDDKNKTALDISKNHKELLKPIDENDSERVKLLGKQIRSECPKGKKRKCVKKNKPLVSKNSESDSSFSEDYEPTFDDDDSFSQ